MQATYAQPGNPKTKTFSVFEKLDYPLYGVNDSLTIVPNPNVSEEENYGYPPGKYPILADCKVNRKVSMQLCRAQIVGDTLFIRIADKAPSSFYELKLMVTDQSFNTVYSFAYPESDEAYLVYPTDQLLVLNRRKFAIGEEIRGFINFRGTGLLEPNAFGEWDSKEDYVPSDYVIRGPFRAVIQ
ncbi:MAG: hypothetical protein AAGN35_27085 [Bacteroidota bacterium]